MNSRDEEMTSGAIRRFSCVYRPGAMKAHIWYSTQGKATIKAITSVTFIGTRNGEITPVAIIFEPAGSEAIIGAAIKS